MPTLETVDLSQAAEAIRNAGDLAVQSQSAEDFELIERRINELEAAVREWQQSMWANEAKTAIRHLEKGEPLTEADQEVIRVFLISDAEQYIAHENNYQDWVGELRRLLNDVVQRLGRVDRESIGGLRGVLKDAIRLAPDIRNFLDERRRINLFNEGMQTMDEPTRTTLARLMREQLSDPNL